MINLTFLLIMSFNDIHLKQYLKKKLVTIEIFARSKRNCLNDVHKIMLKSLQGID